MTAKTRALKICMRVVPIPIQCQKEADWVVESVCQIRLMAEREKAWRH